MAGDSSHPGPTPDPRPPPGTVSVNGPDARPAVHTGPHTYSGASERPVPPGTRARGTPDRLLDPQVLARIDNLDLVARTVMQGFVGGAHPTAKLGTSTDFAEYRGYVPGDDVRRIDWRLYGRTDRLYIKAYEADSNADFVLALDCSGSMNYAGPRSAKVAAPPASRGTRSGANPHTPRGGVDRVHLSKHHYARMAAASLIHLGARQRDRLGFAALSRELGQFVPPSARHRHRIIQVLEGLEAQGPGDLPAALRALATRLRRRAIVIVLSDLYGDPVELAQSLQWLRLQGHDVVAFQVLDPRERDFDIGPVETLEDLESGERMPVLPAQTQADYARSMAGHIADLERECARRDVEYGLLDTAEPLEHLLFRYLSQRARRRRR